MVSAAGSESPRTRDLVARAAPGLWIAFALSGFFLYLGTLDLVGIRPQARITGPYYLLLAGGLLAVAWTRRDLLRMRLRRSSRLEQTWLVAAAVLAAWFLVTATLRSDGEIARNASFLIVVFCLPSALAVLALRVDDLVWLAAGLFAFGLLYAGVSAVALIDVQRGAARFSPIDELDPISAATTATFGALACLTLRAGSRRVLVAQACVVAALVAAAIVPGSRGPLLALALGVAAIAALAFRRVWVLLPAVAAGAVLGVVAAEIVGTTNHLSIDVPGIDAPPITSGDVNGPPLAPEMLPEDPISSTDIRRDLLLDALRAIPDQLLLGHGVGMLRADSEGIRRMVEAGSLDEEDTLTYPHNVVLEAAYSLGLPGLALLLALIATSAAALVRLVRGDRARHATLLASALAAAVAVTSNLSGALGMDAWLWVALALPIALHAARRDTGRMREIAFERAAKPVESSDSLRSVEARAGMHP